MRTVTYTAVADLSALKLVEKDFEVRALVRAKPRAKKSALLGVRDGALAVAIAAPPVDGAANAELVSTLSRALGLPKSCVRIALGEGGRSKVIAITGLSAEDVRARLEAHMAGC
jgi:uncharacterized protein (TIGR00251 family)